jgi:hypothetical protein
MPCFSKLLCWVSTLPCNAMRQLACGLWSVATFGVLELGVPSQMLDATVLQHA